MKCTIIQDMLAIASMVTINNKCHTAQQNLLKKVQRSILHRPLNKNGRVMYRYIQEDVSAPISPIMNDEPKSKRTKFKPGKEEDPILKTNDDENTYSVIE